MENRREIEQYIEDFLGELTYRELRLVLAFIRGLKKGR